jgi:hypothetical protein
MIKWFQNNLNFKQLHFNIFFSVLAVTAIDFLVGKLCGANWKNLITYSLSVYLDLSKHQVWGQRLTFENYSLDKFIGIGLILNTVLFIFLKKKDKIQNNQDIFFQYFSDKEHFKKGFEWVEFKSFPDLIIGLTIFKHVLQKIQYA